MTSNTSAIAVDIASDKDLTGRLLSAAGLPVPQRGVGPHGRPGGRGRQPDRLPGRGQAARRQPRPRRLPRPAERGRRPRGVPDRAGPVAARLGDRRDVRHRQGLPLPGDRRQDRRDRRAGARPRDRRRHAHGRRARRRHQRRPAARRRPREGADPDQGRRRARSSWSASRASRWTTCRPTGRDGQAHADRQHVDRRHLDRPHLRGAPGERRDRRGGRPRRRPRHRRHRLHLPRHHRAGARDRRRDLRGQRRTRLPDAHPPDHRRPAVHLQVGRRHAVPARRAEPDPDRRGHRHQRQDDDVADDRPHLQGHGPQGRHDVDRRRRHRRAAGDPRRRVRTEVGADGAAEPAGRLRGLRGRPRRHPARGPRATSATTSPSSSTSSPTTSGCAASTRSSSSPTSRRCPVEAVPRNGHAVLNADDPLVRAMRRRCSGEVVWFSMEPKGSEVRDFIDVHCRRGGKAVVLETSEQGRHDRRHGTAPGRCSSPGPTCCRRRSAAGR